MEGLLDDGVGRAFFYLRGRLIREGDGGYWKEGAYSSIYSTYVY